MTGSTSNARAVFVNCVTLGNALCGLLGLLPALLIVATALYDSSPTGLIVQTAVAMGYLAAAIVRLSRFTLAATDVPGAAPMLPITIAGDRHYLGMPSPAAAMAVASVVLLEVFGSTGRAVEIAGAPQLAGHAWLTILVSGGTAVAMLKPWPYADPPRAFMSGRWPRLLLVALIAIGAVAGPFAAMSVFAVAYLLTGPFYAQRPHENVTAPTGGATTS